MVPDAQSLASFYAGASGAVVAGLLRDRLAPLWPDLRGCRLAGVGYATPFLPLWRDDAAACLDVVTAEAGVLAGPARCVADPTRLPFDDLSIDRILLVHGLETADDARRLLRECWRVLRDSGRLMIVTPNRAGLWAHVESTPFGQGQPYTRGQVARLLRASLFAVERQDACVFLPPIDLKVIRRAAPLLERLGRRLAPGLAGVLLAEAVKDVYAAMPTAAVQERTVAPASLHMA